MNLFDNLPFDLPEERFDKLLQSEGLRIERILSRGHSSPPDFWYDQPQAEWVLLIQGAARLRFESESAPRELRPGDHLLIPAHARHRVEWTDPAQTTLWLAVHFDPVPCNNLPRV